MKKKFSYKINNPNNFNIINDSYVVPFGVRCPSAIVCQYASLRKFSLPFDWCSPLSPKKIQLVLENNFDDFIPNVHHGIFKNKYNFTLTHFNKDINEGIDAYKRRIDRFNTVINDRKKIYFIFINEDYLFNPAFRNDDYNNNIFKEMLEFEDFIKKKYKNIDYNILYFSFNHFDIPKKSNIINIVLHTKYLYECFDKVPFVTFRKFCGMILTNLFNTKFTFGGISKNMFNK